MTFRIVSAEERLAAGRYIKGAIFGPSGVGKTSLLKTLRNNVALFVDAEGGGLSVADWVGDSIPIRRWEEARDLFALIGGPNPSLPDAEPYSQAHFDYVQRTIGPRDEVLARYSMIFLDSITVLSRMCLSWAEQQPDATAKNGAKDMRASYGILGREMMRAMTHLQHCPDKHVLFVGILEEVVDDFGRKQFQPQIEGSKIGRELPGIVDLVMSMEVRHDEEGRPQRVFVTSQANDKGLPAKDRSGKLDPVEPADLEHIIAKING